MHQANGHSHVLTEVDSLLKAAADAYTAQHAVKPPKNGTNIDILCSAATTVVLKDRYERILWAINAEKIGTLTMVNVLNFLES